MITRRRDLFVIASPTTRGVAIQLDCFVAALLAMTRSFLIRLQAGSYAPNQP